MAISTVSNENLGHLYTTGKEKPIIPTYPSISAYFSNPTLVTPLAQRRNRREVNSPAPLFQPLMLPSLVSLTLILSR